PVKQPSGGPIGTGLPGTAIRNPGPGTDSIISIKNNDSRKITAAKLRIKKAEETIRRFDT
ncbi:hypothetical protein NEUTE2DRAFT_73223, partial [Neurospora tetrasperma FGSC 2509]